MAGLLLIALMGGYVALTRWFLVRAKPLWGKIVALAVSILIPTADEFYYRQNLTNFCNKKAGYRIIEQKEDCQQGTDRV